MTYDVLGSHTRTYEFKFKRVEERSFFIAKEGGWWGGGGKLVNLGDFVCVSKKNADSYCRGIKRTVYFFVF